MNTLTRFSFAKLPRRFLLASATALALWGPTANAADKLPVVASFSILGDIVRVVGGDRVSVVTLVGPDEDAHAFETKPSDVKTILASKLVVTNGLGFEPWSDRLIKSAGYKGEIAVVSKGVKVTGSDPHAWQNPNNVVIYTRNLAAAMGKVDPAGASLYQANAAAYTQELLQLDVWVKEQFAAIPKAKRKVITSHDAFGYFAAHYGVAFLAPQGVSTETEPSAKQIAQLIKQIQREKIRAVFVENMSSPQLVAQLSKDAGAAVGASLYADALSTADKPGSTYLKMMRHNATQLAKGMLLN